MTTMHTTRTAATPGQTSQERAIGYHIYSQSKKISRLAVLVAIALASGLR